jgi:N-acetylglucosaminyldiphosphoundecaprenol N-acetyl-beta-D-mannosaminyltransferase
LLIQVAVVLVVAAGLARWERRLRARAPQSRLRMDRAGWLVLVGLALAIVPRLDHHQLTLVEATPLLALVWGAVIVWVLTSVVDALNWRLLAAVPALAVGAALALAGGVGITAIKLPFGQHFAPLAWTGPVLTILWLVLCGMIFGWNAGLLEIPLGVGGIAALALFFIGRQEPQVVEPATLALALFLAAATLPQVPFARYLSRNAARAGAVTVGFLLGGLSLLGALKHTAFLVALLPLLLIGVPLFSVTYTYVADLRHGGRAVAVQERRRNLDVLLLAQGYSRGQVVGLLLAGAAYLGALALLLVAMIEVSFLVKTVVLVVGLAGGGLLFYVVARLLPRARSDGRDARRTETEEVWLLGVRLHAVTYQGALETVRGFLREGSPHMVVTSDASAVVRAQDDAEFRDIVNEADLVTADGAGVVLASKLLDLPLQDKVSGCDMVGDLCEVAAQEGRSVYFLGAAPGVAQAAAENLRERLPALQVAGCHDGYFDEAEEQRIVSDIQAQQPGLLLVALGIPRQEKWIKAHLESLGVPVCIGIGGSLDVISGHKQRAPQWMQRCGLEWLYRTAKEPSRLPRLAALPRIVWMTFGELLKR